MNLPLFCFPDSPSCCFAGSFAVFFQLLLRGMMVG